MGGRGSGGGRSGGGGGASKNTEQNKEMQLTTISDFYKDKFSKMTDKELNRAYINSRNLMNKESVKAEYEQRKLSKMVDEFKSLSENSPNIESKWESIEKQSAIRNEAKSKAEIREQIHYLAVHERNNVRGKQNSSDVKSMTDGQLNSYYNKSYKESSKARSRIENAKNAKTRAKYQKLYEEHSNNFNKAEAERNIRGLDGKDW